MSKKKRTLMEVLADLEMSDKDKYHWYVNKSDEWKNVREAVLKRDKYMCRCCGRTDDEAVLTVHHRLYRSLFFEAANNYEDLITLCNICHKSIHSAKSNLNRFTVKILKKL